MTSRESTTSWSTLIALTLSGAGCGVLLGLDEFKDAPEQAAQGSGGKEDPGSGGSGGTAGGADAAPICEPSTSERCYSGPAGTEDVGLCRAGTRTCESDGKTWGACEGEVPPRQESCASTEDENCDGFDCGLWARTFEVLDSGTRIKSMAIDTDKNIFAAGLFTGSIQLGGEPLIGAENERANAYDAFIVSLDGDGNYRWGRQFSDAAHQEVSSICLDKMGNVIVAGVTNGTTNLGGEDIGPGIFVAKFDNDGNHVWSKGILGSSANESSFHAGEPRVKAALDGDVILAWTFAGTFLLDGAEFRAYPTNTHDIYVARLDGETGSSKAADGGWIQQFKSNKDTWLSGVAVHGSNDIVITGRFTGSIEFGNISPPVSDGMFLVNMDRTGKPIWVRGFADVDPTALGIDALGNISVGGYHRGRPDFGGGPIGEAEPPLGGRLTFIAQFDITGKHKWSREFIGLAASVDISTDAAHNVILATSFAHDAMIDDNEILVGDESASPLVIKLDPEGRTLWKRWFQVEPYGPGYPTAVGVAPDNEIILTGGAENVTNDEATIDFGTGPLALDTKSLFITKLGL